MSIFSASLSDAELARSTDTFGCELGRRLEEAKAQLAASRALVVEKDKALRKIATIEPDTEKGWCFLTSKNIRELATALALKEADILERLK